MQFGRRRPRTAETLRLRHLHGGYTTPASKAVATVWKNGQQLYTLTDGTNDAWARSVCVADGTVYVAGYEQQPDGVVAKLWENGTLKYTLGSGGGNSYAYAVTAVRGSVYTAGSEEDGGALTAKVWKDGTELYAYSVSPATSQAKAIAATGSDLFAAGSLSSGTSEPTAQIWKNDKAHFTLSDGKSAAGANALCHDGRALYAAGSGGSKALVWRDGDLLYTLTDGSWPRRSLFDVRRTALRLTGNSAKTATGHGQNGCVPFFMPLRSQKRRQNKKLLLFLQENPKQTVTKSYGVQFQGDRAQVAAPLAGK